MKLSLAVLAGVLLVPASFEVKAPSVAFRLTGTAGLVIDGTVAKMTGSSVDGSRVFTIPLASATTGIALRDKHMRNYLEVAKFPEASLTILDEGLHCADGTVRGTLDLHGQKKTAVVAYRATPASAGWCRVKGSFEVDMHEYGIDVPAYLGIRVAKEVSVTVELEVPDETAR